MTGLLTALIIILAVLTVLQIIRIYELSGDLNKEESYLTTHEDNNRQGLYLLLFGIAIVGSLIWMMVAWNEILLPQSASEHGVETDALMSISMGLILVVYFIMTPILFWFSFKYRGLKGTKATYYEHNNKLELIWTSVPTVVLAVLIIYGLTVWSNTMTPENEEDPMRIEVYAQQYKWTARYAGSDNNLGYANVRLIEGANVLGLDLEDINSQDDFSPMEIHLPVGQPILFTFRSQDVIHSAYFPHFRAQMNCVPGMTTRFQFTPTITTADMRKDPDVIGKVERINAIRAEAGNEPYEYDYLLLCNKICGAAHYNMQMNVIVETRAEYDAWVLEQQSISQTLAANN
jgi:cytochrome c oxidase subunit 2